MHSRNSYLKPLPAVSSISADMKCIHCSLLTSVSWRPVKFHYSWTCFAVCIGNDRVRAPVYVFAPHSSLTDKSYNLVVGMSKWSYFCHVHVSSGMRPGSSPREQTGGIFTPAASGATHCELHPNIYNKIFKANASFEYKTVFLGGFFVFIYFFGGEVVGINSLRALSSSCHQVSVGKFPSY